MSEHHPIQDLMAETMEKIKSMVDVNTFGPEERRLQHRTHNRHSGFSCDLWIWFGGQRLSGTPCPRIHRCALAAAQG